MKPTIKKALKIGSVLTIDLSELVRNRHIHFGEWYNTNIELVSDKLKYTLNIICDFTTSKPFINLQIIEASSSCVSTIYRIEVSINESNLRRGNIIYFVCPITGTNCRKLYKPCESLGWGCRTAFEKRLYYDVQICPKIDRYRVSYYKIMGQLRQIGETREKYKGRITKRHCRKQFLERKKMIQSVFMHSPYAFPKALRKLLPKELEAQVEDFLNNLG